MKKLFFAIITVFLVLFGAMTLSASAERYTELPITINQNHSGSQSMFTLTDFEIWTELNDTPKYTKTAYIYLYGTFNQGSTLNLSFYCYDASGNHIGSYTNKISTDYSGEQEYGIELVVPDVTASIEIGTAYPGSWTNTYYYCKYMNVHADDGRVLAIHDLLLPVYENCGWHGPVTMWSLNGDWIEVPYCDVAAYKKVGWYLWPDYYYQTFKRDYDNYTRNGNYSAAFTEVEWAITELKGTYYEPSLYSYKTKLMDAWRKKINGPLAYCSSYVSGNNVNINFRNVSYKTIKAFKIQFDCYDVFNNYISPWYSEYYVESTWLNSSCSESFTWKNSVPSKTDHISNIKVTQVVYSDGTSWYR